MTTTTATFRDYNEQLPEDGAFSIKTDGTLAEIVMESPGLRLSDELTPETARDMGTFLIRYAASAGEHDAEFIGCHNRALRLSAYNSGDIAVALCADGEDINGADQDDPFIEFVMSSEQAIDMGQRLIAWAGVDLRVDTDA